MSCIVLALSYQQGVLIIHANLRKPETIHNVDTTRYVATTFGWYVDICARSVLVPPLRKFGSCWGHQALLAWWHRYWEFICLRTNISSSSRPLNSVGKDNSRISTSFLFLYINVWYVSSRHHQIDKGFFAEFSLLKLIKFWYNSCR